MAPPRSSRRVGELKWDRGAARLDFDLTMRIRRALVDIQYDRAGDTFGWTYRIV